MFAGLLAAGACRPRDKVRLEPTKETLSLASTIHMADPQTAAQLTSGFHEIEHNSWRWTKAKFSVTLRPPSGASQKGALLVAHVGVPDALIQRNGPTTLRALLRGTEIGSATYKSSGDYTFTVDVPGAALGDEALTVDFTLDKFLPAGSVDQRELGIIASSIGLDSK